MIEDSNNAFDEMSIDQSSNNASSMLTTDDNPYNPFTQFDEWFQFDTIKGYNSLNYLGRIANVNANMSDKAIDEEIERAIDEIIKYNPLGIYKKVTKETVIKPIASVIEQS